MRLDQPTESPDAPWDYLRAVSPAGGTLIAHGWVAKPGRRVVFVEGDVRDTAGKVVATASGSCLVTAGPEAS